MNQIAMRLCLRPFIWTHDGPTSGPNDPAAAYFVEGMPNNEVVQLINKRAHGREPLWQIRYVSRDAEIGNYKTPEEGLAVLQNLVDEPTGLLAELHKAKCEWVEQWGTTPEHPLAKAAHRDVEAWQRIIEAHVGSIEARAILGT